MPPDTSIPAPIRPDLLDNDSDVDGDPLAVNLVTLPTHGTLERQFDGSFTYLPEPGFVGTDSFTYRATDGDIESNLATVILEVTRDPFMSAGDDFVSADYSVNDAFGGFVDIPFARLLPNDFFPSPFPNDVFLLFLANADTTEDLSPLIVSSAPTSSPEYATFVDESGLVPGAVRVPYSAGFVGARSFSYHGQANGVIVDPGGPAIAVGPPRVMRVVINDGSIQRSEIGSVSVTFSEQVTLDSGAIRLERARGSKHIPVRLSTIGTAIVNGKTVAVLTFPRRRFPSGSLRDGLYRLVVRGGRVHDLSERVLDGDGDGIAGGDHAARFRRRFGDADGDGDVDRRDRSLFRRAFRKRTGEPGFAWYFDAGGDGRVGPTDLAQFTRRFRGAR